MENPETDGVEVLFVTGDEAHGREVRAHLEAGHPIDVQIAASGSEALNCLEAEPSIRCVVSADDLPDTSGVDLLGEIRLLHPTMPLVFYPAAGTEARALEALEAGATGYISRSDAGDHLTALALEIQQTVEQMALERALDERVKELRSIQRIVAVLVEGADRENDAVFESLLQPVRDGFRIAETVQLRLQVEDVAVESGDFVEGPETLRVSAETDNGEHIQLEAMYPLDRHRPEPVEDGSRFLVEEREFLDVVATLVRAYLERKRSVTTLVENEQLFRDLAENIREVVWITDPNNEVMHYVNPAYETVWGRSVESLYDEPSSFVDAIHPDDRERVEAAVAEQAEGTYDEEFRVIQPDGRVVWVHDRAVPIVDESGTVTRVVGLAEDITSRKDREHQIALLDRVLRHNLRNEMNAIQGFAELIVSTGGEEVSAYGERIISIGDRLLDLSEKNRQMVFDLSDVDPSEEIDLAALLEGVTTTVERETPAARIALDSPPSGAVDVPVVLELAIVELVGNAVEHATVVSPRVDLSATVDDATVAITVADRGPAIPNDEWDVLGTAEGPLTHGSGIGLWLVHWTVSYLGGTVERESNDPSGNRITIHLPRGRATIAKTKGESKSVE